MVLLPDLLQLFLLLSLLELVSSELINVILDHLLIEHLRLVYLLHELLNSCRIVQIPFTLSLFELRLLVSKLHEHALMVSPLGLNLPVQLIITGLELANLLVGQVDCAEDVRLGSLRAACRGDCNSWHGFAPLSIDHIFGCATTAPYIRHILLFGNVCHGLRGKMRYFLRLLLIVVVNVLFDRVALGQHVEYLALVHALLNPVRIRLLLDVHDFFALFMEHVLTAIKGSFKLSLLFLALAELPFAFVDQILLDSDRIKLAIELLSVRLEGISARAVISQDLGLVKGLILLPIEFDRGDFGSLLSSLSRQLFRCGRRWLVVTASLRLGSVSLDLSVS